MRITKLIDNESRPFQRESNKIVCPICGREVDYLLGDDEPVTQPDRGRRGCEDCWKPFKYTKQSPQPTPTGALDGGINDNIGTIDVPGGESQQDAFNNLIKELK